MVLVGAVGQGLSNKWGKGQKGGKERLEKKERSDWKSKKRG